ncbi:MAG: ABC transporter ATP-binding protein [Peptoniphilaceae bacterium]
MFIPLAMLCSGISVIFSILPSYYIWKISIEIFSGLDKLSVDTIKHYAVMIIIYSVFGIVTFFIATIISHIAGFKIEIEIKKQGFAKAMDMPLGFYNEHFSGEMRKVINDGASSTHSFLAHQLTDMASSIVSPIMVVGIFFYIDFRLGLASLAPMVFAFYTLSKMLSDKSKEFRYRYMCSLEEMSNEAVEYVRAIPVVKTFGQSVKAFTKFYNTIENYRNVVISFMKLNANYFSLYGVLLNSTALFLIPVSVIIINDDNITVVISNFMLYLLLAPQLSLIMMRSMRFSHEKFAAEQAIDRFNELFEYKNIEYPENSSKFDEQTIEFKNVYFSYDGENNVLKNINFKVKKGEILALVGSSGSGKTTIARLAARFWDVNSGEILIGGNNIRSYSKEELMNNISFVFQNSKLFKTSLRENICFGNKDISNSQIDDALLKSGVKEIIEKLDDGLDTVIGKKGTYLSGGESQRIALARAFIKNAPIVLLDEATAFADPENEHVIQAALRELSARKTTIMIAHRMTTVKDADNIAVVDRGEIMEYGNHNNLIAKGGLYKKMWDEYQSAIDWNIKKGV